MIKMSLYTIIIKKDSDYSKFLDFFSLEGIDTCKCTQEVKFEVEYDSIEDLDVELLSMYYLIRYKYNDKYTFKLNIRLHWDYDSSDDSLYKIRTYCYFVESLVPQIETPEKQISFRSGESFYLIPYINEDPKKGISSIKIRRMMPLMVINKDSYDYLRKNINRTIWNSIKSFNNEKRDYSYQYMIQGLLNNLLFQQSDFSKVLYELRKELFESDSFLELIEGLPIISIIIFGMFDYAYRDEALEEYKREIKEQTKVKKVKLLKHDFLYEKQNEQKYLRYKSHRKICDKKYDNKTLWENYDKKTVHPFVVKELFEAVSITEGVLQLLENIILHADKFSNKKIGVLSVYMRNKEKDISLLKGKYDEYREKFSNSNKEKKYYFEICITDLSGTNIPFQFNKNNKEYLLTKFNMSDMDISLEDFFDPSKQKRLFWQGFYDDSERAIKHYGLQIFNSIINSRNGLFIVESGDYSFCNLKDKKTSSFSWGTRYQILCPINEDNYDGELISDHLFRFERLESIPPIIYYDPEEIGTIEELEITNIYNRIKSTDWSGGKLLQVNMSLIQNTELFIKGLLKYIYDISKNGSVNKQQLLMLALLECRSYQILEIVRIISLYYDKQGTNSRMSYVQIYIRGKKSGEEILFFGERLSDVIQNITKSACIKGIMYENIDTINYLLKRERNE